MFPIKRNDLWPPYRVQCVDEQGYPFDLTSCTARFLMRLRGSTGALKVDQPATIEDADDGLVRYTWQAGNTDTVGMYSAEIEITTPSGKRTFPSEGCDTVLVTADLNNT